MAREKLSEKKNHYVIYFVKLLTSRHPTTATATTTYKHGKSRKWASKTRMYRLFGIGIS